MQVVPVLAQPASAVRRYIEETGLPFDILIDESRDVVKAYGVWHRLGLGAWNIARPALFLIDRSGAIQFSFVAGGQREFPGHDEILEALRKLEDATEGPEAGRGSKGVGNGARTKQHQRYQRDS